MNVRMAVKKSNFWRWNKLVKQYVLKTVCKSRDKVRDSSKFHDIYRMRRLDKYLKENERDITYFVRKANGWPKRKL